MFDYFSNPARGILALARKKAVALGHTSISTAHLALAVTGLGHGTAHEILASLKLMPNDVRDTILREQPPGDCKALIRGQVPFAPASKQAL